MSPTSYPLETIDLGIYSLDVATTFGPRIMSISNKEVPNPFAFLSDASLIETEAGVYRFRGGHRLWAAPEEPSVTYANDDHRVSVVTEQGRAVISAPPDRVGLEKRITLSPLGSDVIVDHQLVNHSSKAIKVAAWAITQFGLGGTAILPLLGGAGEQFSADASLVVWPYTRLDDPRISWRERCVLIAAHSGPRLKLGSGPNPRRLGYFDGKSLFTKTVTPAGSEEYPERGAVGQVFVEHEFCELETVGPLKEIGPSDSVTNRETWHLIPCRDLETAIEMVGAA